MLNILKDFTEACIYFDGLSLYGNTGCEPFRSKYIKIIR